MNEKVKEDVKYEHPKYKISPRELEIARLRCEIARANAAGSMHEVAMLQGMLLEIIEGKDRDKIANSVTTKTHDSVNHPSHYTSHPSGVECITITKWMNFNVGNAVKYLWRAGLKEGASHPDANPNEGHLIDLKKAAWYVNCEIERLEKKA